MKGPGIVGTRLASLIVIGLAVAALVGGALADAQDPAPDTGRHLLVVPHTPEAKAALARADARTVASYASFTLVEAAGADDERLRKAGADRRDDMRTVRTAAGTIDPRRARSSLAGKEAPERDEVLALVQFVGPPKDSWLARVRATGARVVSYQPENAYVVHASGDEVERLATLVGGFAPVRAVAVLGAADKLEGGKGSATGRYAVQTVAGAEGEQARGRATQSGTPVAAPVEVGALRTQYLELTEAEARSLASDPAVVAVEPYAEPKLADERSAQIVAGNLSGFAPSGPGYLGWLAGPGRPLPNGNTFDFAIDVTDEGLDGGTNPPEHSDFRVFGSGAGTSRIAYLRNYSSEAGAGAARDCGGHGTHVASIATGHNAATGAPAVEDTAGYNHGLGVAPFALVGVSKIFNCAGAFGSFTPGGLAANAYLDSARVSNNSWGTSGTAAWGSYSTRAQQYDAVVRDARAADAGNQELVEVFAAGNDGDDNPSTPDEGYATIMAEATAKNVITVGAAEGVRASGLDGCGVANAGADSARDIIDFSSRGPTDDGRLKPDIVAPGTHITGARPRHGTYNASGTCTSPFGGGFYSLASGSSQAAPHVSGAAAVVRRAFQGTPQADPSPALTKALLLNSATDLAGGDNGKGAVIAPGPNTDQGWGRVNLGAALGSTSREYRDQEAADTLTVSGQSVLRTYRAVSPGAPVKVTLAWTDAPGAITGNAWVNNLDLEVEAGGRRYLGNVFAGAFSRLGGSADTRNNVESVYLPAGAADRFAVTVRGLQITGDGVPGDADTSDQDFALVVSNADDQPAPVFVHDSTTLADPAPEGDGDTLLESDEQAELTEGIRNAGTDPATGITASLSSPSADLDVTQGASAYPDLAAGASGANATPFGIELANAAPCGVDVPANLDISAGPETQRIALSLPTGEAAAIPKDDYAGGLPLQIPDDSATGVSSSVFVSARGRIRDLNVRLPGTPSNPAIDHAFVGDVVIDLIGPDGTTVRLAEHPGGPDNSGKDFVNVTFDDEAPTALGADPAPYSGTYRPQNDQLSRFDGKSRRGTWTLRVRDLFEEDSGFLNAWGVSTRKAVCNFDTDPPETNLGPAPSSPSTDTTPTFNFSSDDPAATFECSLDFAQYEPCSSPKTYPSLSYGSHNFRVRAVDGSDNEDVSAAEHIWTIDDTVPPSISVTSPASGSTTADTTPLVAGVAGRAAGDAGTVTVKLWSGTLAAGLPAQTRLVPRNASSGAWSAVLPELADGTYTVRAEQSDSASPTPNVGVSNSVTFRVQRSGPPPPPLVPVAPSFLLAPAEEGSAKPFAVTAACASGCELSAKLTLSARTARRLGLGRRALAIATATADRSDAGQLTAKMRPRRRVRRALAARSSAPATLAVTLAAGSEELRLRRSVSLRRTLGLSGLRSNGLRMWTVCSESCPVSAGLTIARTAARRLGIRATAARVRIASKRLTGGVAPTRLTLRLTRRARRAVSDATRLAMRLEVQAGAAADPPRPARRSLTLRR